MFKDCYIEANGSLKFHALKSNNNGEEDEEENAEEFNRKAITESYMKLQLKKLEAGQCKLKMGGVFSLYANDSLCNSSDIKTKDSSKLKDISINVSAFYEDLNLKFYKNNNIPFQQVNNSLYQLNNFKNIFLNMDDINKEAGSIINEHLTKSTLLLKEDLLQKFPFKSAADEEELNLEDRDLLFLLNVIKTPLEQMQEDGSFLRSSKTELELDTVFKSFEDLQNNRCHEVNNHNQLNSDVFLKRRKLLDDVYEPVHLGEQNEQRMLKSVNKKAIMSNLQKLLVKDELDTFYCESWKHITH